MAIDGAIFEEHRLDITLECAPSGVIVHENTASNPEGATLLGDPLRPGDDVSSMVTFVSRDLTDMEVELVETLNLEFISTEMQPNPTPLDQLNDMAVKYYLLGKSADLETLVDLSEDG